MKQYTFFITGRAKKEYEIFLSLIIDINLSNNSLISKATRMAMEKFAREVKKQKRLNISVLDQVNLIGVQEVYKDENGELKAIS